MGAISIKYIAYRRRGIYRVDELLVDKVLDRSSDRLGLDGVDRGPSKTEETIVAVVLEEARAELLRELDRLAGDREVPQGDRLRVDVARRRGAVPIADVPRAARLLGRGRLGGVVDGVALVLGGVADLRAAWVAHTGREIPMTKGMLRRGGTDLQTQRSDDPVSKSRLRVTPGVPILTGTTYSRLCTERAQVTLEVLIPREAAGGLTLIRLRLNGSKFAAVAVIRSARPQGGRNGLRTVLDGGGGDLVLGVLVGLGLDLDDDPIALRKAGVAASLEAVAVGRTGVRRLEGGPLALVVLGADEGEHLGHGCGGFCG